MGFRRLTATFGIGLALCGVRVAFAADDATARVQAAYDAQCADLVGGAYDDYARTLGPSYVAHLQGQAISRTDFVASLKSAGTGVTLSKCTTTIDSVTTTGDTIVVVVQQVIDGMHGETPFELAAGKRDMWTPSGSSLLESSSTSIWTTVTVNGEIVQQTGTPPSAVPTEMPSPRREI